MIRLPYRFKRDCFLGFIAGFTCFSILSCSLNLLEKQYNKLPLISVTDRYNEDPGEMKVLPRMNYSPGESNFDSVTDVSSYLEALFNSYNSTDDSSTDSSALKRKQFLVIIHSGINDMKMVDRRIRSTWADDWENEYIIVIGKSGSQVEEVPSTVLELDHSDFPSTGYLTLEELAFILSQVRKYFRENYLWFLLVPTNSYISSYHIDDLVSDMDPNELVYVGHPGDQASSPGSVYCEAGPGILMSYTLLQKFNSEVGSCIISSSHKQSDKALGECLKHHLKTECYKPNMNLKNMFFYDKTGTTRRPNVLWQKSTPSSLVTLYPIQDYYQLEAVHAWSQTRQISRHRKKASDVLQLLQSISLCDRSFQECNLLSNNTIFSVVSYKEFSWNCSLFPRGYVTDVRRWIDIWDIAMGNNLYSSKSIEPQELLYGWMTDGLHYATSVAMEVVKQEAPDSELVSIVNSYIRHKGTVGQEFILDLELLKLGDKPGNSWYKRVALLFPFHKTFQLLNSTRYIKELTPLPVHLIVPISGLINRKKISRFMKSFFQLCISAKKNCKLTFVLFNSKEARSKVVKLYLNRYSKKYPNYINTVLLNTGQLNKTTGYDMGMSALSDNSLAVLIDENIALSGAFLERCRQYAIQGFQIYAPDIFKQYNLHYVYPKVKRLFHRYGVGRVHGHWAKHSVLCIYKSDYIKLGQYKNIAKWNMHPEVVPTPSNGGINVIQSLDAGVLHKYEEIKCDTSLPPVQFSLCLTQRRDDLGDRSVLANYALSLEEKCNIKQAKKHS